jgi:hypothetical protein
MDITSSVTFGKIVRLSNRIERCRIQYDSLPLVIQMNNNIELTIPQSNKKKIITPPPTLGAYTRNLLDIEKIKIEIDDEINYNLKNGINLNYFIEKFKKDLDKCYKIKEEYESVFMLYQFLPAELLLHIKSFM